MHRYRLLYTLLLARLLLGGCADDEDKILGSQAEPEADLNTWIWVMDDDTGTIWIHDADTGSLEATPLGEAHPLVGGLGGWIARPRRRSCEADWDRDEGVV